MNNIKKLIISILFSILCILCWAFFSTENDIVTLEYNSYVGIKEDGGVKKWLPEFFPKDAENIYFYSNLDVNFFYIEFELNEKQSVLFEKGMVVKTTEKGTLYIDKINKIETSWCKHGVSESEGSDELYLVGKVNQKGKYVLTAIFKGEKRDLQSYCEK
ncbi:hypothetical protein KWG64_12880 [Rahnella sp. PD12R]|uniref:hypothetical protein n=1 Tax=Rahnella sp. PD12R TaxID=2855688 RepID=UPI001C496F86|nr:hypothetical protein [Rahnella sp. PD12R]MBV6818838.1 hypothetical protein [Rahnella sp. PD12R]